MAQQPHDMTYLDYGTATNRSPSSSRQNYANFASGLTMPRQNQRPFDAPLPSGGLYSADRLASSYGSRAMDNIGGAGGMPGYMMDNNQSWNYNGSGVATVGGAVHGSGRQRSVNRRAALPSVCLFPTATQSKDIVLTEKMQNWTEHGGMGMPNLQSYSNGLGGASMGNGGLRVDAPGSHPSPNSLQSVGNDADQLIPTAIVIKNIPFAVRKETLASIMLDMHLPQPYAFNYHFDNGVFRGLAFANFQSAEDTRVVIEAMNGMDVHGRKLRVEYKKMLPEAERERIEREKRERRGQLEEQHRAPLLHNQSSLQSLSGGMPQPQPRTASAAPIPPTTHLGKF